ncbi:hypothetical protein LLG07_02035 [bacterium]|nr:hypothetical protein [bacterium]
MASIDDPSVLNIGTLTFDLIELMTATGKITRGQGVRMLKDEREETIFGHGYNHFLNNI